MLAHLSFLILPLLAQSSPGYLSLFDGESLKGWVTEGGRYDGAAAWSVEEGCIVGRQGPNGEGGLLYTERPYASFDLRLEAKIDYPFDSGVFLHMAPDRKGAQITLDWREGGEVGAVYSDGFLQHNESGADHFRRDEWNDLRVRCTGFEMRIEFWLNGTKLTDYQLPDGAVGYSPTGLIGLQVHGAREDTGAARFRNVRIAELPLFGEQLFTVHAEGGIRLTEHGQRLGWKPLFDGQSLEGWEIEGDPDRYEAKDGVLSFLARGGGGHIFTKADYRDFRLRLDFRTARMANSGLFLRAARDGTNPAYSGCEVQILDDFNWEEVTGSTLMPWQFTGSLYGAMPPLERDALRPLGEWNTYEVLYRGQRLAVALNGRMLYDVDTHALQAEGGAPFADRAASGFIGLQHHGADEGEGEGAGAEMVGFRNLYVQEL